jgi:hypothetical protein
MTPFSRPSFPSKLTRVVWWRASSELSETSKPLLLQAEAVAKRRRVAADWLRQRPEAAAGGLDLSLGHFRTSEFFFSF